MPQWFRQPLPDVRSLLAPAADDAAALGAPALPEDACPAALARAEEAWERADAYFFRAVARVQKLWAAGAWSVMCALCVWYASAWSGGGT